jgi:hypothetical protein
MRREMARTRMLEAGARQMPDGRLVMPDVYDAHMEKVKALGGDEVIEYPFDYGGPLNRTQSRESQEELRTLLIGRRNFQPWLDVRKPLEPGLIGRLHGDFDQLIVRVLGEHKTGGLLVLHGDDCILWLEGVTPPAGQDEMLLDQVFEVLKHRKYTSADGQDREVPYLRIPKCADDLNAIRSELVTEFTENLKKRTEPKNIDGLRPSDK